MSESNVIHENFHTHTHSVFTAPDEHMPRERDRQTERQRQTDRHIDRQRQRDRDIETDRLRHRQTERNPYN